MPIDLSQVDWLYVVVLGILVFVSTIVGGVVSFGHRWTAATLSTLLFVALFVFWTYYPHRVPLLPENDYASECVDHDRRAAAAPAGRSCGAAEAEKSGHGHHAAQPGHRCHAAGFGTNSLSAGHPRNATRPLGLQAAVIGVSHDPGSVAGEEA